MPSRQAPRWFRGLLRLFPFEFRDRFGRSMSDDFVEQQAHVSDSRVARLASRTVLDLVGRAVVEHMDILRRDVRHAVRLWLKRPALFVPAVITVALAVGVNTVVFSVLHGVLLKPLPLPEASRLVRVFAVGPQPDRELGSVSRPNFVDYAARTRALEATALVSSFETTFVGPGSAERITAMSVSAGFFPMFSGRAALGRLPAPEDFTPIPRTTPGVPPARLRTVVLSDAFWRRAFDGRSDVIGHVLQLRDSRVGNQVEVIGVASPDFSFARSYDDTAIDCWIAEPPTTTLRNIGFAGDVMLGRLARGVATTQAQAEFDTLATALAAAYPEANKDKGARVVPLHDTVVGGVSAQIWFLFGAAGMVLLIGLVNVSNLLLVQVSGRRAELALRLALGATRAQLARQTVTEALVLTIAGGAVGVALAACAGPVLQVLLPTSIPRLHDITIDLRVLSFGTAVTIAGGVLCGLLGVTSLGPLPPGARVIGPRRNTATDWRSMLLVVEVALTLALVVAAGLMVRTVRAVDALPLGFDPSRTLSVGLTPNFLARLRAQAFEDDFVRRVRTLPGVVAAGLGTRPIDGGGLGLSIKLPGSSTPTAWQADAVTDGYLDALGARMIEGRFFRADDTASAPPVVVLNQAAARVLAAGGSALGRPLPLDDGPAIVVGVIANVRRSGLESEPEPTVYFPASQTRYFLVNNVLIRAAGDPLALLPAVRQVLRDMDPEQALARIRTLDDVLDDARAPRRFTLRVVGVFSALAMTLALVGIYGVFSRVVQERTSEIGIRMALGATARAVLSLVVGRALVLSTVGIGAGLVLSVLLSRTMATLVFGVQTTDALTYVVATMVLSAVTFAACLIPARRAAGLDPVVALREGQ